MSSHYIRFGFVPPLASFVSLFALSTTSFLRGQEITIVSPSEFANKEGEGQSADACCPFSFRYQQLFPADDFSSLPDGQGLLTSIAWRPDGDAVTGPRSTNLGHTVVRVSTTRSNALEDVLDANVTSEPVTVVDGTVRLQTADLGPDGGPKEFDYVVRFDTPFFYDTAQGNLLFDWDLTEGFAAPAHLSDGFNEVTDPAMASVRFATPVDAPTGFFVGGFVQQFSFVPEPSSTALACMGLLTCFLVLRRRRTHRGVSMW